jgi:hypothetical protein
VASLIFNLILWGANVYKFRVISDYEERLPKIYQGIVDECNELKAYLELEERASREPYMRGKLNEMICKYARYFRKEQK